MPIMVEREKWILYKHTSDYSLIQAVALDVKNSCESNISETECYRMQERLAALDLYKARNSKANNLDAIKHRINTLEFFMFGYESPDKHFIFSPLGNLYLKHIQDGEKTKKIFTTMLIGMQFTHPANNTPRSFQLYPFRLLFKLMLDERLECKLYSVEYAYIVAFVKRVTPKIYEDIVRHILSFRKYKKGEIAAYLEQEEHTYVNCIYEWQYYIQRILKSAGILEVFEGEKICKLYHPQKPTSHSKPTGRWVKYGYTKITSEVEKFVMKLLDEYSVYDLPLRIDDNERLKIDIIKEIYAFYPRLLLEEINEVVDEIQIKLLELPKLIDEYAKNPDNATAYLFEDVLLKGFNMFVNVEANKVGGAGNTDIECLYITKKKKFAVEAKSTANKLSGINAGRLREHRNKIGGRYTIVVTPRYVPAAKRDILNQPIVLILANTLSEYLYNNIFHDVREIDYEDFDRIITNNLGTDVSKLISDMTMKKFATK